MKFNPFQLAAEKAKQAVGDKKWNSLGFAEQSAAIYRELRSIDAELVRGESGNQLRRPVSYLDGRPSRSPCADRVPKPRREIDSEAA